MIVPSFNRVIIAGHATRDPELKTLPSGTTVCEFGLAANRKWKSGEKSGEEVLFVDCAAFGRQGEVINQYVTKGKALLVEGRLKLDQWTDQSGGKRSKISIVVENFTFLSGDSEGGDGHENQRREQRSQRGREYVDRERSRGGGGYDNSAY